MNVSCSAASIIVAAAAALTAAFALLLGLQERQMINNALTREVMRVHRQLQHAAQQLKGPAQLPALQAWDAAFSQVSINIRNSGPPQQQMTDLIS